MVVIGMSDALYEEADDGSRFPSNEEIIGRIRNLLHNEEAEAYSVKVVNAIYFGERDQCYDFLVVTVEGDGPHARTLNEHFVGLVKDHSSLSDSRIENEHPTVASREFSEDVVPKLANTLASTYARVDAVFRASEDSDGTITPQVKDATGGGD